MANNYLSSSFILEMTADDAEMVRLAQRASEIVEDPCISDTGRDLEYADLGPRFAHFSRPRTKTISGAFSTCSMIPTSRRSTAA
jgi:hypothetical protein